MKYSEIKELYKNVDQEIIREYYEDFPGNGLSILSAALNLGIENDLGGMYEYVSSSYALDAAAGARQPLEAGAQYLGAQSSRGAAPLVGKTQGPRRQGPGKTLASCRPHAVP